MLLCHVDGVLARRLEAIRDPTKRLTFVNELLGHLQEAEEAVLEPTRELQSLLAPAMPDGRLPRYGQRPRTPLNDPALLTNAHGEPSLASRAPSRTRLLRPGRSTVRLRHVAWGTAPGTRADSSAGGRRPLRVVTTTYIGGTDARRWIVDPRLRRPGEDSIRRCSDSASRQGLAVPPQYRLRHGVRRFIESLDERPPRWRGVECAALRMPRLQA